MKLTDKTEQYDDATTGSEYYLTYQVDKEEFEKAIVGNFEADILFWWALKVASTKQLITELHSRNLTDIYDTILNVKLEGK
jgi:hypothetical protein